MASSLMVPGLSWIQTTVGLMELTLGKLAAEHSRLGVVGEEDKAEM